MPIKCFDKITLPGLADRFRASVKAGMSDAEQQAIGMQLAMEYHKGLHDKLNEFKAKLGQPTTEYSVPDTGPELAKINTKYDQLIQDATKKETPAEAVNPEAKVEETVSAQEALKKELETAAKAYKTGKFDEKKSRTQVVEALKNLIGKSALGNDKVQKLLGQVATLNFANQAHVDKLLFDTVEAANEAEAQRNTVISEQEKLKGELKQAVRGYKAGIQDEKTTRNKIVDAVQSMINKAKLAPKVAASIMKRVNRVNRFNLAKVQSLLAYVAKSATDAEYHTTLDKAKNLQRQIGNAPKESTPAQRAIYKEAKRINPSKVDDIDGLVKVLEQIKNSTKGVKEKGYEAMLYEPALVSLKELQAQVEATKQAQAEELAEEYQKAPLEDVLRDLEENSTPEPDAAAMLLELATQRQEDLQAVEELHNQENLLPARRKDLQVFREVDLNDLTPKQLQNYARIVDNILNNEDFGNSAGLAANLSAKGRITEATAAGLIGRTKLHLASMVSTVSTIFEKLFGENDFKIKVLSGWQDVLNAKNLVEKFNQEFQDRVEAEIKRIRKSFPKFASDPDQEFARIQVIAALVQYDENPDVGLERGKRTLVHETQNLKAQTDPDLVSLGEFKETVYNEIKDKSHAEILEWFQKTHPAAHQLWEFIRQDAETWKQAYHENTESVYNQPFVAYQYFTPITTRYFNKTETSDEVNGLARANVLTSALPTIKQSPSSKLRQDDIGNNQYRDPNWLKNYIYRRNQAMYDIHVSRPVLNLREFISHPQAPTIFGTRNGLFGESNTQIILDKYKALVHQDYINLKPAVKVLMTAYNAIVSVVHTATLGGLLSGIGQYTSTMANYSMYMATHGGLQAMGKAASASRKNSVKVRGQYPIGRRSQNFTQGLFGTVLKRSAGVLDSALSSAVSKLLNNAPKLTMSLFIRGDFLSATAAWDGVYLLELSERGVNIDNVGTEFWDNEAALQDTPIRKYAAARAEQFVEKNFMSTQTENRAEILKATTFAGKIVNAVSFAYGSYIINHKDRVLTAYGRLLTWGPSNKAEAMKQLAQLHTEELAIFATVGFVVKPLVVAMYSAIVGQPPETDEDKEEQSWITELFSSLNPVNFHEIMDSASKWAINHAIYNADEQSDYMTYEQWKKKNPYAGLREYRKDLSESLGLVSIFKQKVYDMVDLISIHADEDTYTFTYVDPTGQQREKKVPKTDELNRAVNFYTGALLLSMAQLSFKEFSQIGARWVREEKAKARKQPPVSKHFLNLPIYANP